MLSIVLDPIESRWAICNEDGSFEYSETHSYLNRTLIYSEAAVMCQCILYCPLCKIIASYLQLTFIFVFINLKSMNSRYVMVSGIL